MPLDPVPELTLDVSSTTREAEVMTRVLRLPTDSIRQARAIVRMQLDRLSPLPVDQIVFDLVRLQGSPHETTFALGILRRSALQDPGFANRRMVLLPRSVEGAQVVFRFRNPSAVDDRETRWLAQAPRAALIALGLAAVLLAGQIRADQWREARLPVIAAEQRIAARAARDAREQATAAADWRALERSDAATRLLCVAAKIGAGTPSPVHLAAVTSDATQVRLTPLSSETAARLVVAGGEAPPAGGSTGAPLPITFGPGVCG